MNEIIFKEKSIKVCYTDASNAGDAINPIIIKEIFGYHSIVTNQFDCDISGIGSGLRRFFIDMNSKSRECEEYLESLSRNKKSKAILWSAGFLSTPSGGEIPISEGLKISSVRGKLSKKYVEKILNKKIDCSVGDGGLLVSKLIRCRNKKEYSLGIIPHRSEKNENAYKEIRNSIEGSVIIDIENQDVMNCIRQISQCETVISSSLHGLIFADSFCIPNAHVFYGNRLAGDGFKFKDYYSTWDMDDTVIDLNVNPTIDVGMLKKRYTLSQKNIENKQKEICDAFMRYL